METKKTKTEKSKQVLNGQDFIQFLKEKKERDEKLSKIGEWFLSGKSTGWYIEDKNLKYILR